jgi:hypothetical protein
MPRYEDMEQEALVSQMVDAPTPYSATGPDTGVKRDDPTALPTGPQATTQPIGRPTQLDAPGDVGTPSAPSVSVPTAPMAGGALARYGTGNIAGAENLSTGSMSMPGFNTAGWGTQERGTNSIKNTFGKIASRYDPRAPNATQQIVNDPDFKQFFPEAKIVPHPKGDLIDFGDGRPVDVLVNAREGGSGDAWAWQTQGGGGAAGPAGPAPAPVMTNVAGLDLPTDQASSMEQWLKTAGFSPDGEASGAWSGEFTGNTAPAASPVKNLMAEIQAAQNGQQSPMDLQALMALLGQQRGA